MPQDKKTNTKTTAQKKPQTATATQPLGVVGSTFDEKNEVAATGDTISIAVCLATSLAFDIDLGSTTKRVVFYGLNEDLRGKPTGVLALSGNALCQNILKSDWEAIKQQYGSMDVFTGINGNIPCIYEVGDVAGFNSAKANNELKEMDHGLSPIDPNKEKDKAIEEHKEEQ